MKRLPRLIFSIICLTAALCLTVSSVFGWFSSKITISDVTVSGSSPSSYFASGTGTEDDPYIITKPIHLYNLAWLQYIGTFNAGTTETDGSVTVSTQYYFELNSDLNMNGYVLPPIGTTLYPFIGSFSGNYHKIENLTISNTTSGTDTLSPIKNKPPSTKYSEGDAEVIGFFGVVGNDYSDLKDYCSDLKNYTYSSSVVKVENVYLDYLTIVTQTSNALVGLVAGYVNGTVKNVGVWHSAIKAASSTSKLYKTVDNTKSSLSYLSDTSLIGKIGSNINWENVSSTGGNTEGGGVNPGFGGSLDMYTFNRRLTYMFGASVSSGTSSVGWGTTYLYNTTSRYNAKIVGYLSSSNYLYALNENVESVATGSNRRRMYVYGGSYLPLNVNTSKMFTGDIDSVILNSSYQTYTTNYYTENSYELVSDNNTGYFVGSTSSDEYAYMSISGVIGSGDTIYQSITTDDSGDIDKITLYAIDSSSTTKTISDSATSAEISSSNYVRYNDVYKQLKSSIIKESGGSLLYNAFQLGVEIDPNTIITATTPVRMGGKTISTGYQFLASSVNFSLTNAGYITAVIANTTYTDGNAKMFKLYKITRNDDNTIKEAKQVIKTYVDGSDMVVVCEGDEDYTSKTATLKYSSDWYDTTAHSSAYLAANRIYYVEIPVTSGDYAIGTPVGYYHVSGAYFLYLDVGANSSGDNETPSEETVHVIKDVYFVNSIPKTAEWSGSYSVINISIDISTLSSAAYIYFVRIADENNSNADTLTYYCSLTDNTITLAKTTSSATTVLFKGMQDVTSAPW